MRTLRAPRPPSTGASSLSCTRSQGRASLRSWRLSALCLKPSWVPLSPSRLVSTPLAHPHLEQVTVPLSGGHTPLGAGWAVSPEVPRPQVRSHNPCPRTVHRVSFPAPSDTGSALGDPGRPSLTLTSWTTLLPKRLRSFSESPSRPRLACRPLPPRGAGHQNARARGPADAAAARPLQACPNWLLAGLRALTQSVLNTKPVPTPGANSFSRARRRPSCRPSRRGPQASPRVLKEGEPIASQ